MTNQARPWSVDQVLDVKQKLTDYQNPYKGSRLGAVGDWWLEFAGETVRTTFGDETLAGASDFQITPGVFLVSGGLVLGSIRKGA